MKIERYRARHEYGVGIAWSWGDGYIRPKRRGFTYTPPIVRLGLGPWLWRIVL